MSLQRASDLPIARSSEKARTQFAALCYRINKDKPQVLLLTSRTTKRWITPKGWPIKGCSPAEAAAQEAYEEAGVQGRVRGQCLGIYSYDKVLDNRSRVPVVVAVFPLKVKRLLADYPEVKERRRKWYSLKKAAARVDEPELRSIILSFDPARVR